MQNRWCPGNRCLSNETTAPAGSLQSAAMAHRTRPRREGRDPTRSAQPRMPSSKLACGFSPAIAPICDGAEQRIAAAGKGSGRAQLSYCMTQPYKAARALLMCHGLSKNRKTKRKLQSSCKGQKTSHRSPPTCHASCLLSLLPSRYTSPSPPSALFANKRSNLHPPLYLDVFTFFIFRLPSI